MVIGSIRQGMGFKRAGVFLVEPDGFHLKLAMGVSPQGKWEKGSVLFPLGSRRGHSDQSDLIFGHKKYLLSNDVGSRYKEGLADQSVIRNMAVVPIYAGQRRPIGNLAVDNLDHYRRISLADVAFLTDYATLLGLAIQSIRNYEQAVRLSNTDPLTGLYNRRFFERALGKEIQRSRRYRHSLGVVMADIDHFKRINDTYGHDVGDEVLKQVASILKEGVRGEDIIGRLGGEEFAILLPETPLLRLPRVVRRAMRKIKEAASTFQDILKDKRPVTLSFGLSSFRRGDPTPQQLLKLSDQSLYWAKEHGRNRSGPVRVFKRSIRPS
jgi:diguanylate cyclase (GGDEF)-like protein